MSIYFIGPHFYLSDFLFFYKIIQLESAYLLIIILATKIEICYKADNCDRGP